MRFPVDLLAEVSQAELEQLAHNYMNNLLYSNPDSPEQLILSDSTQVTIDISSVGFIPLYGSSDKHKILALFSPSDSLTAVALYLLDQWWAVDNILKTADPARDGAVEVETVGERIVLYILNRVIYRAKEMSSEELPFLCHGEQDYAKILWNNGEAVGFYSVKPSGSLCKSFSPRSYQLPVMDSIFVRKCQRGKGFGLQMLEDFVLSFKEDCLGLRYPLTTSMYKVCEKYLCQYPEDSDLLWEVESIGGPNQRTNIARKLKAMDLSAVSKGLTFTEESLVITEVTEKDVVMEAITTQIKEAESIECTVEIVEEVTVLKATKVSEAELPVAGRGRSSGSKQRTIGEKITEDKSEKVIRIEDIEAETPRDEQVSAKQKTEMHDVSELVQTEGMFSVTPDEKGEDAVHTAPKYEATTMSAKQVTVLVSQDQEEADGTSMTEVPQAEDDTIHLDTTSHDSQITVENVPSEIKEAEDDCQKEDTEVMVVSQEVLELHKEAGTLIKVNSSQTQIEVTDEKSKERVTQCELSSTTHVTLEGGEAGKTKITVGKAIKFVQGETPRRRSQRHRKPEEEVKEEATAQDEGKVLRRRTVLSTPTPKRKYTQHSQKVYEELEREVDEVAEENIVSTPKDVQQLAVDEEVTSIKKDGVAVEELGVKEKQQLEDEQLTNEQETEKQEEPGMGDIVPQGSTAELQGTPETALIKEHEDETSVIQDKQEVSNDETEDPPIIQKRAFRGRRKVTSKPKPIEQGKIHQKQEEEHTDEAELGSGGSASEEKTDEKAMDKELEEQHQGEQEETVDKAEEEISTKELNVVKECIIPEAEKAAQDVAPWTVVNMGENKEVREDEETKGEMETVSLMEADNNEMADGMMKEPDTVVAASETIIPNKDLDEAVLPVAVESQEKMIDPNIPKLQKATVILVDLKATSHHPSVKEAEETPTNKDFAAQEKEQMEMIAPEEKEVSNCIVELQTPKPEMLVLEEKDESKKESHTEKSEDAASVAETVEKEELEENNSDKEKEESANLDGEKSQTEEAPSIETKDNTIIEESNQQQERDDINDALTKEKLDEAETDTVRVEREMEVRVEDDGLLTVEVEKKQSPVLENCADTEANSPLVDDAEEILSLAEVDDAIRMEEEEAPVKTRALRSGTKTVTAKPRHKTTKGIKQVDEKDAENSGDDKQALTTRTLRQAGWISATTTPKGKSRRTRKQIQEEEQKGAQESISVKDDEQPKESGEEAEIEEGEEEAGLESAKDPPTEKDKGKDQENVKIQVEKENFVAVEVEKELSEEGTMTVTEQEKNTAEVIPAVDDLVQEGDTDTPLATPTTISAVFTHSEEEEATAAAEDQKSEEMEPQLSDLQRLTVVLVDLKNTYHEVQEETSAVEEGVPTEKTATNVEEEESEKKMKEEVTMAKEHIPGSPVGIEKAELDMVEVVEEVFEEIVEDSVTIQDKGGEEAVETAKQDEAQSVDEEEEPAVTETRTLTSRKQVVKATPTCKVVQSRQEKSKEEREETSESREEQAVQVSLRVLRRGRKSIPVKQRYTGKKQKQQKQLQEEEGEGEGESTAVEEREEEEEQAEEQRTIDQEKDRLEAKDAAHQEETIEPEMDLEIDDTVVVKAVKQQNTPENGQATSTKTIADENLEASVGQSADEGNSSGDIAEEAVTAQDIVEGEQSTSMSEMAPVTANNEEKYASEEEEPPIKTRVLRSCEKTVRSTPRSRITKRNDQEEEASCVKSTEEDEPTVERRVLRKGRRSAAATPNFKSKRARTQHQTEEKVEETTPAEEMQVEEAKAVLGEAEEVEENKDEKIAELNEEKVAGQKEENTEPEEDYEQKEKAAGEGHTVDELAVETRVLRKGRRSVASTPRRKSKRACTQPESEEKVEKETTQAEDIQVDETQADEKDDSDEIFKEAEEPVTSKEGTMEPKLELNIVKAGALESLTEQETREEEQSVVSQRCTKGQKETPIGESTKEIPDTNEGKVSDEGEAPVVETRLLRSGVKSVRGTPRSKNKKSQEEENEEEGVENSVHTDEPTGETRVLRKGRRSAPATPRYKTKRGYTRCQLEEEGEEETSAEETEGEEKETGQKLVEEKQDREETEEEGESMKIEEETDKDVEEGEGDSVAGGESALGDTDQMKSSSTEEAVVVEKEDKHVAAVDETGIDMDKVGEANLVEEEKTTGIEKCTTDAVVDSTSAIEEGAHTAVAKEEAPAAGESVVTGEEAPAVTTRTLRSKTKTLHATPSQRSRRHKDQGVVETQLQEVENPEDEEMQDVHQLTDDSLENRELNAKEQVETEEISSSEQKAGSPAEDNAEDQAKEIADLVDDKVIEPACEEPAKEETELPEEEPSKSKEDKTVDSSGVECKNLRGSRKIVTEREDKAEEIQLPKRRSTRKRPRVEYMEKDDEDEESTTEPASDEEEDNKKPECSANEPKLEESSREENLEGLIGAVDSTGEKEDIISLVLDTNEEVEEEDLGQDNEEDEQNMSEEEVEPTVIEKRVLRGRSIPSLIITPQHESRRSSSKVKKSEKSLSDEIKSPQSDQKRSLRKRKSTEVTPTRKSKITAKCRISKYYD